MCKTKKCQSSSPFQYSSPVIRHYRKKNGMDTLLSVIDNLGGHVLLHKVLAFHGNFSSAETLKIHCTLYNCRWESALR